MTMGGKLYDSMQVRIIGPWICMTKGMLLKKREITRIQLPCSMIKALPILTGMNSFVANLIKNFFPSDGNRQLGQLSSKLARMGNDNDTN